MIIVQKSDRTESLGRYLYPIFNVITQGMWSYYCSGWRCQMANVGDLFNANGNFLYIDEYMFN